jgi:hypothetical protein
MPSTSSLLRRALQAACVLAALSVVPSVPAWAEPRTGDEVQHLLDYLGRSGCQFNRNGDWHDARAARDHLQEKYDYLKKRDLVPDAQAFIERAASKSSMSGKPYQVRCGNGQPVPSARWLGDELARYRAAR